MSPKKKVLFILMCFIFLPFSVRASLLCLSGNSGNNHLVEQFENAKKTSGITKAIIKKYGLDEAQETKSESDCSACELKKNHILKSSRNNLEELKKISEKKQNLLFKESCLVIAGNLEIETNQINCPSKEILKEDSCITKEIYNYENAVISDFYSCVKKATNFPINALDIFMIYSNESAFKPNYYYNGGLGIAQLTSVYVQDMLEQEQGRKILQQLLDLESSECEIAKNIIEKDFSQSPLNKTKVKKIRKGKEISETVTTLNACEFIKFGEGLERNILYSILGLANNWERYLSDKMPKFSKQADSKPNNKHLSKIEEAQRLTLINSYGGGGQKDSKTIIKRMTSFSVDDYLKNIKKPLSTKKDGDLNWYLIKTEKKQQEIKSMLKMNLNEIDKKISIKEKLEFEKNGAKSCIN